MYICNFVIKVTNIINDRRCSANKISQDDSYNTNNIFIDSFYKYSNTFVSYCNV